MLYVYSPRPSNGARELANELEVKRLKNGGSLRLTANDNVINWGSASSLPHRCDRATVINRPDAITDVSNKLTFFQKTDSVRLGDKRITPKWWSSREEARDFLRRNGGAIVCRTVLSSSGGNGIVIADAEGQLVDAQLYTRYIPKQDEYRIHVMRIGNEMRVIDKQRKAKRLEEDNVDWRVRNLENGFVFVRQDVRPPQCVVDVALACMNSLSLDFGAVDVIYNNQNRRAYVLEVNSAPGLEGQTVINYANGFREMLNITSIFTQKL